MIGRDHQRRHAEHLRSCQRVNVIPAPVGFDEQRIMRKVRQQPQLDLRIISRQEYVARLRNERRANSASQLGANRNILQVRICRRQPACRSSGLPEGGVQPSSRGIDQRRQRIHIRRLELRQLPVVEDHARNGMVLGQLFEHVDRSRNRPPLAVFHRLGQVHAIE